MLRGSGQLGGCLGAALFRAAWAAAAAGACLGAAPGAAAPPCPSQLSRAAPAVLRRATLALQVPGHVGGADPAGPPQQVPAAGEGVGAGVFTGFLLSRGSSGVMIGGCFCCSGTHPRPAFAQRNPLVGLLKTRPRSRVLGPAQQSWGGPQDAAGRRFEQACCSGPAVGGAVWPRCWPAKHLACCVSGPPSTAGAVHKTRLVWVCSLGGAAAGTRCSCAGRPCAARPAACLLELRQLKPRLWAAQRRRTGAAGPGLAQARGGRGH